MHTHARRVDRAGLTIEDVLILLPVLVITLEFVFSPHAGCNHGDARRIRCRNNLNQLAKGMATYLNEYGDNRWFQYPLGRGLRRYDYCGSEWLASLYWTGIISDPDVFICPSSPDTNELGMDIGTHVATATFGSQTVSYAGMHYYSQRDKHGNPVPGAIPADYAPNSPMASDDTEGDINHGTLDNGGMSILFFDTHVEFRTHTELDLKRAVGDTDPDALLRDLRN